jgi:hypothetical protein
LTDDALRIGRISRVRGPFNTVVRLVEVGAARIHVPIRCPAPAALDPLPELAAGVIGPLLSRRLTSTPSTALRTCLTLLPAAALRQSRLALPALPCPVLPCLRPAPSLLTVARPIGRLTLISSLLSTALTGPISAPP